MSQPKNEAIYTVIITRDLGEENPRWHSEYGEQDHKQAIQQLRDELQVAWDLADVVGEFDIIERQIGSGGIRGEVADWAYDAMCVWEWVMEELTAGKNAKLQRMFADTGYANMREKFIEAVPVVRDSFRKAKEAGYEDCFDWHFIPWFMANCWDHSDPRNWKFDGDKLPPECLPAPTAEPDKPAIRWAIFTGSDGPVGRVTGGEKDEPDEWMLFDTEREAQIDILDDLEEHVRQFKEGERDYDMIDMPPSCYAQEVLAYPDGSVEVKGTGRWESPAREKTKLVPYLGRRN
jgi:hypothetical protein